MAEIPKHVQKPSLARMVLVVGAPANSGDADVAPAVVTRVWSEHPDGGWSINATVFPDAAPPVVATSIRLVADEEQARALLPSTAAFWPPRI